MIVAALALSLAGATAKQAVLTVAEAKSLLPRAQGRIVSVRGRISSSCGGLSCSLEGETPGKGAAELSIARVDTVERRLVANRGRIVTLRARFGKPIVYKGGDYIAMQTDRANELIPIEIEK